MSDLIIRDTPITPTVSACPHCNKTNWTCTNMGDGYERLECHECGLVLWGFVGITTGESAVHAWNLLNTRPAPVPRVKPLEWVGVGGEIHASAFGIDRAYLITRRSEGQVDVRYVGNRREEIKEGFKSQPEAKSWVFDHYERRILSALDMEKDDG